MTSSWNAQFCSDLWKKWMTWLPQVSAFLALSNEDTVMFTLMGRVHCSATLQRKPLRSCHVQWNVVLKLFTGMSPRSVTWWIPIGLGRDLRHHRPDLVCSTPLLCMPTWDVKQSSPDWCGLHQPDSEGRSAHPVEQSDHPHTRVGHWRMDLAGSVMMSIMKTRLLPPKGNKGVRQRCYRYRG